MEILVSFAAVFRLVAQRWGGALRCMMSLKTAVKETKEILNVKKKVN